MATILQILMKHTLAGPFLVPVDPVALKIPDYFHVIKNPMDLGTVKTQLVSGHYTSSEEAAEDIRLVWKNAITYNPEGTDVHNMASKLSVIFEDHYKTLQSGGPAALERRMPVRSISELKEAIKYVQAEIIQLKRDKKARERVIVGTILPKPRAAPTKPAPEQKEMTWAEKAKLTAAINELDEEHLSSVVNIIQDRNPQLAENAESELIEIDLEAVDTATLRALERFVAAVNRKKTKQTKAPNARDRHAGPQQKLEQLQRRYAELGGDPAKREEEVDVDIGDHVPNEYPPVTIEKDMSSSSSSSSDITSSDSSDDDDAAAPAPEVPPQPAPVENAAPVVANLSAWSNLDTKAPDTNPNPPATSDALWSEFKTKEQQNRQREKEREEQEEAVRTARLQADEERKQKEEQQRLEKLEAEQRQRQQELEAESENQKKLAEKREAARKAREQTEKDVDLNAQRVDMSAFEKNFT